MGQSRAVILVVVLGLSVVVPAALCFALLLLPFRSVFEVVIASAAAASWMCLLVLVNWWEFTGTWLRWLWTILLGIVILDRARHAFVLPPAPGGAATVFVAALLAGLALALLIGVLAARKAPARTLDLVAPFRDGRFLVTDGGDGARSFLANYHYGFGTHRASGMNRTMRYAIDVVEIGPAGSSSRGLLPRRNAAFRIWERPLLAPCDGRVVHVVNDVADNAAFGDHRPYGLGNHVVICAGDDVYLVMGHMRQGSVVVVPGQHVLKGDAVGRVGNSGWTERPHVHLQAMRSAHADWWHGEAVAMRFDGRFLVRNQQFRA